MFLRLTDVRTDAHQEMDLRILCQKSLLHCQHFFGIRNLNTKGFFWERQSWSTAFKYAFPERSLNQKIIEWGIGLPVGANWDSDYFSLPPKY